MPKYFFSAKSQKGEEHSGTREAKDKKDLARILHQEGYVLISAAVGEKGKGIKTDFSIPFLSGVSLKEKIMFTRNLRVMISAGISLPRALKTLSLQSKSSKLKKTLLEIVDQIIKGKNFSETLSGYPDIFSELFCSMMRVGEESGTLEENLNVLTRQMERENDLKNKVKGAIMYPAVIIAAMLGVAVLMLVMVVPKLAETFEELQVELPTTTKVVIALGTFASEKWYLFILIMIAFFFFMRAILRIKRWKKIFDKILLKIPIISQLIKKTNSAYMVRTLSSLISSGVSMIRALEIISESLGNYYFKESIAGAVEKVKKGERLSEILKSHQNLYPITVIQMIEVGEETGETSEILQKLADFFEEEVTNATKNLGAVIEPILMLLIGAAVGFFAISMIQPMYSMLESIK